MPGEPGIAFDGELEPRAHGSRRKNRGPCRSMYTAEQAGIVERAFRREIELFGYTC